MKRHPIAKLFLIGAAILACLGFTLSLLTGNASLDIHLHDTYFVVAHHHIVLAAALLLAVFAGIYYLFSRLFQRQPGYRAGLFHFLCTFAAMLAVFMPAHYEGVAGMPRRYYDYSGWGSLRQFMALNRFVSGTLILFGMAQLVFFINLVVSAFKGRR